jgi:hypothetical protein
LALLAFSSTIFPQDCFLLHRGRCPHAKASSLLNSFYEMIYHIVSGQRTEGVVQRRCFYLGATTAFGDRRRKMETDTAENHGWLSKTS